MVVGSQPPIVIDAEGLSFGYGSAIVINGVDLKLRAGEFLGVLGPNGSGKSTLLGLLCGLLPLNKGRIQLFDRDLDDYRRDEIARTVGVVVQTPELNPGFTVLETVLAGRFALMGRRMFENDEDLAEARRVLDLTDLEPMTHRRAGELSGGERQRLTLARALAARPRVLLLDEPTSALDLEHQLRTMSLLEKACSAEGLSVCLVSHDLNLAALFADRLMLLSKGRVLARGRPDEVIRPDNLETAYGVRALVDLEPSRNRPRVTLVPPESD